MNLPWKIIGAILAILPFLVCPACHYEGVMTALGNNATPAPITSSLPDASPAPEASPTSVGATEGNLEASVGEDGKITLSGIVPDEATKTKILDAAKAAYGADNVIDKTLEVKEGAKSDWVDAALGILPELKAPVKGGGLTATNASLAVRGALGSDADKGALGEKLKTLAGTIALTDETTAPAATEKPKDPVATPEVPTATPEPEVKKVQGELNKGLELKIVEFQTSKAFLTRRGRQTLDFVASELNKVPDASVDITGHTDNRGDDGMNQQLSEARAKATLAYLVKKGISKERLTAMGLGETKPKANNNTPTGRQRNRRIEFKLR
jgi:OmpA-OmpF porin, OOP family